MESGRRAHNPLLRGVVVAVLAAAAFGLTTPFIQRAGTGLGAFTTAALLYLGAALGTVRWPGRPRSAEASLRRVHLPRLVAVAVCGAAIAPALFAWGLQRMPAAHASLLLNAEAALTLALAAWVYREHIGARVALAAACMVAGGAATVADASAPNGGLLGSLAVLGAVFFWALDNTLTRPLAELDPTAVVRAKAGLGVALTAVLAMARREVWPSPAQAVALLALGLTGYGLSLRLYLGAQRQLGAGRTASIFAVAPFLGALAAWALGERALGELGVLAGALFAGGVALHLTERHRHAHTHPVLEHEHAHRHDDGHHAHAHDVVPVGTHSHWHRHESQVHEHPHGPDAHHRHSH